MMTDKERNNTIESNPDTVKAASNKVKQETENLHKAIQSVAGDEILIVLPGRGNITGQSFADWAHYQPNEITIDSDQDPRAFEREYRKYVMRQKHK